MRVRHLHQRTRPFRRGGLWLMAAVCLTLTGPMLAGDARTPAQIAAGVGFCALWPQAAERCRRWGPRGDALRFEMASYVAETGLVGLVLAWVSVPPPAAFATGVCLLAGAAALAGWRLLLPATAALLVGALAGGASAPQLTTASDPGADLLSMLLLLGFVMALARLSFQQAQRLDAHRQSLAEKSALLERVNGRLQRYLPPSLKDRVLRAPDEPCGWERRWLTVAFADLVGFTELAERLEAEPLASILDDYLVALIAAAERRGGEVSKVLGDGVLVVFGLRDGDRRATVAAALGFCGDLPALLEDLARRRRARGEPVALRMRAGIASGFCTLGDRGGGGRLDFTLIGTPVNLASRLQSHARENGVLMDEASASLAETSHCLGEARVLQIKGLGDTCAYALASTPAS